jgi:peptidoglycan lytic transglycosylase G
MHTRHAIKQRRRRADLAARLFILSFMLCVLLAVGVVVGLRWTVASHLGRPAADLNPVEAFLLTTYLAARAPDLTAPAGSDPTPIPFSVQSGESAAAIAERLATEHLVNEARLIQYYLRYTGLDNHIEAGEFVLRQTMTVVEIASALTDARDREISVRVFEGWRLEQIAEALNTNPALSVSKDDFIALAGPNGTRSDTYAFVRDLPPGASLEGFLFPDTYFFRPGATASDAINKMLANFDAKLPADYRAAAGAHGLNVYQAITVASLVEREAVVDDERPLIASVILNRLAIGQPLEIDATVQYALGTPGNWWPSVNGLDFHAIANLYNTYTVAGLPPGPIANPGLRSILAAAHPADTKYLYYRALCDGSGRHAFAATYEEHLANACP